MFAHVGGEDLGDDVKTVFQKADIQDGHIHRFRDTFAVRLLEKGVSIETSPSYSVTRTSESL